MTQKEIMEIMDTADLLMRKGKWSILDDLLEYYGNAALRLDREFLLSWATATNVGRSKLQKRKYFMEQCIKFHSDPEKPTLWKGLWEEDIDPMPFLKSIGLGT